jgi:hypothetical protein
MAVAIAFLFKNAVEAIQKYCPQIKNPYAGVLL